MDESNYLTEVVETRGITKEGEGAVADGKAIDINSLASMNMWGFTPEFLNMLEDGFKEFFENEVPENPLKSEFLIPIYVGDLLKEDAIEVKALKTHDKWCGMTYKEDVSEVKEAFRKMLEEGKYKEDLFSDL